MRPDFFHHLHPPTIPEKQARFRYTLGAGGMAVFLVLVALISGGLEMFYYVPTVDGAALSIQMITYVVPFGNLLRNLHYWSAQLLIFIGVVHLVRIVFTGSYAKQRHFNYLLGIGLFLLLLMLDFTGYILRWDTGVEWALIVGTNLVKTIPLIGNGVYHLLVGGEALGQATLIRFYAWHIFGLIILAGIIMVWHIFRVRHDGGIAVPPPKLRETHERIPRHVLVLRETLAMVILGGILFVISLYFPAPIAPPISDIGAMTGDTHAPWFLLWVQYLLRWGDPFLWGVIIPVLLVLLIVLIPYVFPKPTQDELGRWFLKSNRLAQFLLMVILLLILVLTLLG